MQKNTSVTLGRHFDTFIVQQIENGRFASASEAIRAGLRLIEEKELKLDTLRRSLDEGENSGHGEYTEYTENCVFNVSCQVKKTPLLSKSFFVRISYVHVDKFSLTVYSVYK